MNHGVLLYFSPWLSPSATSGGGWEDSTRALPLVETFGLSLLMLAACKWTSPLLLRRGQGDPGGGGSPKHSVNV